MANAKSLPGKIRAVGKTARTVKAVIIVLVVFFAVTGCGNLVNDYLPTSRLPLPGWLVSTVAVTSLGWDILMIVIDRLGGFLAGAARFLGLVFTWIGMIIPEIGRGIINLSRFFQQLYITWGVEKPFWKIFIPMAIPLAILFLVMWMKWSKNHDAAAEITLFFRSRAGGYIIILLVNALLAWAMWTAYGSLQNFWLILLATTFSLIIHYFIRKSRVDLKGAAGTIFGILFVGYGILALIAAFAGSTGNSFNTEIASAEISTEALSRGLELSYSLGAWFNPEQLAIIIMELLLATMFAQMPINAGRRQGG